MLPLLRLANDGNEHRITEALEHLGREFNLSSNELSELLPSGKETVFANRTHWAKTYLSQAGLLENCLPRFLLQKKALSPAVCERRSTKAGKEWAACVRG